MYYKRPRRRRGFLRSIYSFAVAWLILNWIFPIFRIGGFLMTVGLCSAIAYFIGKNASKNTGSDESSVNRESSKQTAPPNSTSARKAAREGTAAPAASQGKPTKSYGPEIDPIIKEGNLALSEMGRLYMTIKDNDVRIKINEIMRITDKIMQDAIDDPADIPQIKKFFRYYLPTTIKLLNAYDRMSSQGIEGENIDKSMSNITEMLDVAIEAYKKRLDSLFENQALDIETDIDVLNQMLAREGLTGEKDFNVHQRPSVSSAQNPSAFSQEGQVSSQGKW